MAQAHYSAVKYRVSHSLVLAIPLPLSAQRLKSSSFAPKVNEGTYAKLLHYTLLNESRRSPHNTSGPLHK